MAPEARPTCAQFARAGRCARGDACWFPHLATACAALSSSAAGESDGDAPTLVLQTPRVRLERVAAAAAAALRCRPLDAGDDAARGDDSRGCDFALFVPAPPGGDVGTAAAALAGDVDLAAGVTRALWVRHQASSAAEAAAAAATAALATMTGEVAVRLRVFPSWAYEEVHAALRAAGLRCNEAGPPPAHVLDLAGRAAARRWAWALWPAAEAPALLGPPGRVPYDGRVPSRALHKLDEALRRNLLRLHPGDCCADVGAAPGGWTLRLSAELLRLEAQSASNANADAGAMAGHVWAVDPGELTLVPMPRNATHLRLRGEDAAPHIAAALGGSRRLSWVLCDANTHPPAAAALVLALEPLMAADCGVMLSYKRFAPGAFAHAEDVEACRTAMRARGFRETACEHLFANGTHERTAVWRRGAAEGRGGDGAA